MDIYQILIQALGPILTNYWWLWLLLTILSFLKTPFMKGVIGEALVNLAANLFLDKQVYKLFKNVTLPTEDGGTTQIDHVIVSRYGVFVIETKNMKGWIFGSANQKTWTQKIYRHTNQFQNPLHQNYKHTQTLQSALNIESDKLFSLVVFIGDSEFKTPMPENVVYAGGYIRFIKSKRQPILTDSEVANIGRAVASNLRLKPTSSMLGMLKPLSSKSSCKLKMTVRNAVGRWCYGRRKAVKIREISFGAVPGFRNAERSNPREDSVM